MMPLDKENVISENFILWLMNIITLSSLIFYIFLDHTMLEFNYIPLAVACSPML